ncbi:hypothetical protein HGG71_11190, partial [Rhodobacteraceae bacterium R_SAG2]|nr:hypothetical protein [Rhodobacteraceae bacterium R_SAG2]
GGVVDDLLGDDGLVGGVLGDNGVVDLVLGDDGLVGGLVGDDGVVGGLLGDDGLLGGLLGGGGSEPTEIVSADLVDAAIPDVPDVLEAGAGTVAQVADGVLGDGGLVDSIAGDDGLVGGVLSDDGVVDMVLGDDALAGGLLAEGGVVDELVGDDGLVGGVLGDDGVVDMVLGNDGLLGSVLGGGSPEVEDVAPTELPDATLVEVSEVLDAGTETVTQVVGDALGEAGPIGGIIGNDGVVDDLLANDGLVGGLLGGEAAEAEEDVPAAVETTLTEVSDAVETAGETVAEVAGDVLGDGGLVDGVVGDDGLLGGLLGGGAEVEEVVPTDLADAAITEVSDALEDGAATAEPVINAAADAGSVVDDVAVVGGILGGLLGGQAASSETSPLPEEPVADASGEATSEPDDVQASLGQDETDPITSIETPQSSPAADLSDAALLDDVPPSEDAGDDGFLDTLVAGATEDLLGSAETLLDPSDPLLDGLLGEDDVFGLNVVEGDEGDDLFAGLAGEQGLTGSLVEQDVLGLSNSGEEDAPDAEVDNLLNDILAGGVSDITGEDGAFDALLNNDAAAEEEGELLAADDAAVAEAGAVEGALDILFDQGADSGHSLLGGLLQETSDIDNA